MTGICTRLAAMFIIISILTACYKTAQTQYTSSTISYRFDEPRDYCQESLSDDGVNMQCEEGEINIKFMTIENFTSASDFIDNEYDTRNGYRFEEIEGKRSKIIVTIRNDTVPDEIMSPTYVAVLPMRESLFAIAEGFPVNGMESDFDLIFKNLIASFEPYPQKGAPAGARSSLRLLWSASSPSHSPLALTQPPSIAGHSVLEWNSRRPQQGA